MNRLIEWAGFTYCLLWLLVMALPAWIIWVLSLGSISLDIRFGWAEPWINTPAWTRNELTWFVPRPPFPKWMR